MPPSAESLFLDWVPGTVPAAAHALVLAVPGVISAEEPADQVPVHIFLQRGMATRAQRILEKRPEISGVRRVR